MRKLYYGERGCGKTTKIIEEGCNALEQGRCVIVLSATKEQAKNLAYKILDKVYIPSAIMTMDIKEYVKRFGKFFNTSKERNDKIVVLVDDVDAIAKNSLGCDFIASVSVNDNFEVQELKKVHTAKNVFENAKLRIINTMKHACSAPDDLIELDFEKHENEILNGTYVPIGMRKDMYFTILNNMDIFLRKEI